MTPWNVKDCISSESTAVVVGAPPVFYIKNAGAYDTILTLTLTLSQETLNTPFPWLNSQTNDEHTVICSQIPVHLRDTVNHAKSSNRYSVDLYLLQGRSLALPLIQHVVRAEQTHNNGL